MWPTATSCQGRFLRSLSFSTSLDLDIFLSLSISLYSPLVLFTYIQHPHVYFAFSFHISVMSFGVSSFFGMSILAPFPSSHDLGVFLSLSLSRSLRVRYLSLYVYASFCHSMYVRTYHLGLLCFPFTLALPLSFILPFILHRLVTITLSPRPFISLSLFYFPPLLLLLISTYVRTYLS